ncbi:sporulation initiation phosphotransferase B [Parageobacillus thermoglucosidasius]|uniref:Sporulation protein n=1 Tax=Parageobacillus thermoglucosidasius TaxID=1426 RepID=A0AAN0YRG0_PARTM|nr:sporulation initiation phosphotransferase B [Parageobacillus thermoglucosidasius]ALF11662.1 sporulation protein [Parageobacillus thermoglucosidasius]ANZ31746.1 sporulation protein [Parageobacillus thermoglucosidasius]APM82481.1 sporulation protein [Parageobacillus thermoglucosidasius]KJX69599.1 sporulation protein [Parageobacillus thermoglucosidasius]RDE26221.1 sporulation protein [Parageobacillus thermoglucosidasius]
MENQWRIVDVLRHSRHDWLNKIQLIKGNLALNKIERVNEIIDEIICEMQQETKLTNLKAVQFAEWMMTYNWKTRLISLEYEVLGDECDLSPYDADLTAWSSQFLNLMETQAEAHGENHMSVSIEVFKKEVKLFFDYCGTIKDKNRIVQWLRSHQQQAAVRLESFHIHNHELTVLINIAF